MKRAPATLSILALTCGIVPAIATPPVTPAAVAAEVTPGTVMINEVESNGDSVGDWIELANTNPNESVDISGWSLVDNDDKHTHISFPAGTTIESGGYLAVYTEGADKPNGGFGLGGNDSARLFDAAGILVDSTSWTQHAATTWGCIPDMTGEFAETPEPTRGMRNGGGEGPGASESVQAWPFDPTDVANMAVAGMNSEDFSGIDFDDEGNAWVVNNDHGELYKLTASGETWTVAHTWQLRYPDGTGLPDAEGVTVGPDGRIYVATERNNQVKATSRPSVLAFDAAGAEGTELVAAQEWNLADLVGAIGPNAGLEAIEYVPDAFGGVFAVGVEANGQVLFVDLSGKSAVLKQRYQSPFAGVMALDYRADDKQLRVLCDEACDGNSILTAFNGTEFAAVSEVQARPAAMGNVANEGFASHTVEPECVNGSKTKREIFLWADDANTNGTALRQAVKETTTECTPDSKPVDDPKPGDGTKPGTQKPGNGSSLGGSSAGGILVALLGLAATVIPFFLHNLGFGSSAAPIGGASIGSLDELLHRLGLR